MKIDRKIFNPFWMAAGCVAILATILALTTTTVDGSWGLYLLLLLCPAMHFLMHRRMHGNKNRHKTPPARLPAPKDESPADDRLQ